MSDAVGQTHNGIVASAKGLSRRFGRTRALTDINLDIRRGEVLGIVGPNGAGKSTLLNLLGGVLYPSAGAVTVFGMHRWRDGFEIRRRAYYLPAAFDPADTINPYDYHRFLAQVYGLPRQEFRDKLAQFAAEMAYLPHLAKAWAKLSLGLGKKAGLIGCFLVPVELRFLDEPFAGGIDPLGMEILFEWMDRARARGETTVFSTQVLDQAEMVCDRLALLDNGRLVALDAPAVLMESAGVDPAEPRALAKMFFRLTGGRSE